MLLFQDDIVCLPRETANQLGNFSELAICTRVTSVVQFIDPKTAQSNKQQCYSRSFHRSGKFTSNWCFCIVAEMSGNLYWREPFRSICTQKHMSEFTVMDCETVREDDMRGTAGQGRQSEKVSFHVRKFQLSTLQNIFSRPVNFNFLQC